jgi:hypothetical protein
MRFLRAFSEGVIVSGIKSEASGVTNAGDTKLDDKRENEREREREREREKERVIESVIYLNPNQIQQCKFDCLESI